MVTQTGSGPDDFDAAHVAVAALAQEVALAVEEVEEILANGARGEQLRIVRILVDVLKDSRQEWDANVPERMENESRSSAAAIATRLGRADLALDFRKDGADILPSLFQNLAVELAWVVRRRYGPRFLHIISEMWRAAPFVLVVNESTLASIQAQLDAEEKEASRTSEDGDLNSDEVLS